MNFAGEKNRNERALPTYFEENRTYARIYLNFDTMQQQNLKETWGGPPKYSAQEMHKKGSRTIVSRNRSDAKMPADFAVAPDSNFAPPGRVSPHKSTSTFSSLCKKKQNTSLCYKVVKGFRICRKRQIIPVFLWRAPLCGGQKSIQNTAKMDDFLF